MTKIIIVFTIFVGFSLAQPELEQIKLDIENGSFSLAASISGPEAVKLYPDNPTAHLLYAKSLYLVSKLEEARAELTKAYDLKPKDMSEYEHLSGLLLARDGDTYQSRKMLKKAFEEKPTYEFAMDWARVSWQSGHIDEAITAFREASKTTDGKTEGWPVLNIARLLYGMQHYEEAITLYNQAFRLFDAKDNSISGSSLPSPGYVEALFGLGQSYEQLGDLKRAEQYYKSAKNSNPNLHAAADALARLKKTSAP